jgi:hypothetical protein
MPGCKDEASRIMKDEILRFAQNDMGRVWVLFSQALSTRHSSLIALKEPPMPTKHNPTDEEEFEALFRELPGEGGKGYSPRYLGAEIRAMRAIIREARRELRAGNIPFKEAADLIIKCAANIGRLLLVDYRLAQSAPNQLEAEWNRVLESMGLGEE